MSNETPNDLKHYDDEISLKELITILLNEKR